MKVKIDSIQIEEKKKTVALLLSIADEKGALLKKNVAIEVPLEEYSKEKVLAVLREAGVKYYLESKRPANIDKKLILRELKDLEHEFDEKQIQTFEFFSITREGSPPNKSKIDIEPKAEKPSKKNAE